MIELNNVAYSYGGDDLLSGMTLQMGTGTFHFLTGPSGAGKTTFMKLCYGALLPTDGQVRLFDHDVSLFTRDDMAHVRRRVGVVHQDCAFLDHLSVAENVALPLTVSGQAGPEHADNLHELMAWVGLSEKYDSYPPELSGGERQRAALARALILSPDIILADEPTGNVDWEMSQRLLRLLVELNKMGKTVIIATHDLMLIRAAKSMVPTRILRIANKTLHAAGAEL